MSEANDLQVLLGEIKNTGAVLERINAFYADYQQRIATQSPRATETAIVLADILVSAYTCLETLFLRISQCFENTLARDLDQFQEFLQRLAAASGRGNGPEAQPDRS